MTDDRIRPHEWGPLHTATATLLGGPTSSRLLLQAVQTYRRHGLDTTVPSRCRDLGYAPWQHRDVLLLLLAGLSADEIAHAHASGDLPSPDALRALAALNGRGASPVLPPRPKRGGRKKQHDA